jgi:hypothetical protein
VGREAVVLSKSPCGVNYRIEDGECGQEVPAKAEAEAAHVWDVAAGPGGSRAAYLRSWVRL